MQRTRQRKQGWPGAITKQASPRAINPVPARRLGFKVWGSDGTGRTCMLESAVGVSTDTPALPPSRLADGVATSTLCGRALVCVADASVLLFASCVACHVRVHR
jgi:hypothetical protein